MAPDTHGRFLLVNSTGTFLPVWIYIALCSRVESSDTQGCGHGAFGTVLMKLVARGVTLTHSLRSLTPMRRALRLYEDTKPTSPTEKRYDNGQSPNCKLSWNQKSSAGL